MVGAAVEILRIDLGINRMRDVLGKGCDEFNVRQPYRTCGLRLPPTRHQLMDCCSNTLSLSHGLPPWLGLGLVASSQLATSLHCSYTFGAFMSRQKFKK